MREMTVRQASQNFSQVISAAERGETVSVVIRAALVRYVKRK